MADSLNSWSWDKMIMITMMFTRGPWGTPHLPGQIHATFFSCTYRGAGLQHPMPCGAAPHVLPQEHSDPQRCWAGRLVQPLAKSSSVV
jgi:hypothetical protein